MSVFVLPKATDGQRTSGAFIEECYEKAVFDRDACAAGWLKEIREKWAESDSMKMKALAAITLKHQCKWTYDEIAVALAYTHRAAAFYAVKRAIRELRNEYATLTAQPI